MLFDSFSIDHLTLRNRIVMSPMCMYSAEQDGLATDWHLVHYATRATGQVGLIIIEATGIEDRGRISANDLGLWNDVQGESLKKLVNAIHSQGAAAAIQLNHAGRKSEVPYLEPVAPSAVPFSDQHRRPQSLTKDGISQVIENFVSAARRAVAAGFDAIEIHAAHGYLLNQFMSPLVNRREDEYGGKPANRVRLLGEVLTAVKAVVPSELPVWVRVSAEEYESGGNDAEAVAAMLNEIKGKGLAAVHVSSGGVTPISVRAYPGYQIGFAQTIKDRTGLPVIGGGVITEPQQAEQVLKAGIDLVFLGRELLRNPYWPLQAATVLKERIEWPVPYEQARV